MLKRPVYLGLHGEIQLLRLDQPFELAVVGFKHAEILHSPGFGISWTFPGIL